MGNSNGRPVVITDEVKLEHFKLLRVVGKGAFGKVRIVERKDTGLTFALKYLRKDEIVRSENVRNIVRERRMLEHLNHPFLCNLRYSFQDYEYIYLVVDLMSGGDLRFHITRKTFTEDAVRFWVAELGCALRYIHTQGVVHRDVKPDNVLLDAYGHVHLADFNVASDFKPGKALTSKSGTLAYLAPEVYEGAGYSSGVDWWSLGVLFYECIYNKRPFEGSNHEDLANRIKAASPRYPATNPPVSTACSSSIKSLIQRRLPDRIGANGFDNFKNHPFFNTINFDELEKLHIPPVFIPNAEKTNFDATYDLEELLLEESPLEARMKHQKPRPALRADATPREKRQEELYRMIEQYFEPFDYTSATTFKDDQIFDRYNKTSAHHGIDPIDNSRRQVEIPAAEQSRLAPAARVSISSATSPTDNRNPEPSLARPINIRAPSSGQCQPHSPSGTNTNTEVGSPPLVTQISTPTMRTEASTQDLRHPPPTTRALSELGTTQANALVAAASAIAAPQHPAPPPIPHQGSPQQQKMIRPTPSPRSKSVSVSHFRNTNKATAALTSTSTSVSTTPKSTRQVLSADSAAGGKSKDKKGGFLGILGKKSGGGGGGMMGREKSPKRVLENGVLGKDGARVVVD